VKDVELKNGFIDNKMVKLNINKIKLVRLEGKYLKKIMDWRMDSDITKSMYSNPDLTYEKQKAWFRSVENDLSKRVWVIIYDNIPIGVLQIDNINNELCHAFWGYYIGENTYRDKGIGKIVEANCYNYCFDMLGLSRIHSEVFTWNRYVIINHLKLGNEPTGYFNNYAKGWDIIRVTLTKERWDTLREKFPEVNMHVYDEPQVWGSFGLLKKMEDKT
jgi:UDP-4-amino-4,6-dideoxy-N-acetyl-beta-L-altrosamine N-acetyltransferase